MILSELARQTEYTVETIKFFLRENLLPKGEKITERLADYDEKHVRRLALIRALHDRLGMQYQEVKAITVLLDEQTSPERIYNAIGLVQRHLAPAHKTTDGVAELTDLLSKHEIQAAQASYLERLAGTLEEMAEAGMEMPVSELDKFIPPLKQIVEIEMESDVPQLENPDDIVRFSALGMYYTSSISQQLVRIIEQSMARTVYQQKNNRKEQV